MHRSRNTRRYKFPITGRRSRRFLEALAETGNVTAAAAAAGISRGGAYDHRQIDDAFARAWAEAEEIAADRLETEAWRRAVDGVSEPVISMGKLVRDEKDQPVTIQRYSDNLLLALLRARRPERFRDRTSVELDISDRLADLYRFERAALSSLDNMNEPREGCRFPRSLLHVVDGFGLDPAPLTDEHALPDPDHFQDRCFSCLT